MRRGDIVIVPFPFQDHPGEKVRPAIVVQSDTEKRRLANTVFAMITGNLKDLGRSTTLFVDPTTPDGASSGLDGPSLIKCYNLGTIRKNRVIQVIGHLSDVLKQQLNDCLRAALDIA